MDRDSLSPARTVLQHVLRDTRREAGLSQAELADKLGVAQSFVSRLESGTRHLDVLELRLICAACRSSLITFLERLEVRLLEEGG